MPSNEAARKPSTIPLHRTIPALLREPLIALEEIARRSGGDVVRLNLGLFRPYLITHPDHVQHVLRDNAANYVREGMFWKPLRRLFGSGILVDGPTWEPSRRRIQPLFAARNVNALVAGMADAISEAVDRLDPTVRSGLPLDASDEMARIVHRTVARVFFGDRITAADTDRLIPAIDSAAVSIGARLVLPFVPDGLPMPGDRAFRRAVRTIDAVVLPLVRACRSTAIPANASGRASAAGPSGDIVSTLCQARDENGDLLSDRQVRDDVVSLFAAGTETTATALTWLWVALDARPDVAARMYREIDRVVGTDRVSASHLPGLQYTRMVLQELVRLYPVGWLIPRTAAERDVVGGRVIKRGGTVLISPYLTHRMPQFWDRPDIFDPDRFAPGRAEHRDRFAYFPFGGGPHQCLGSHLFTVEAQLIAATILTRYRPQLRNRAQVTPLPAASLRPRQPVELMLAPVRRPRSAAEHHGARAA